MKFSLIRLSPEQSTDRIPRRHSGWPSVPATPETPRRSLPSLPLRSHTRLEVLRYDGLCCPRRSPLLLPSPTSARRSTTSRATLIGFAVTGAPEGSTLRAGDAGVETDLSCSVMDCVIVPLPLGRRVPRRCASKLFTPSMAFAHRNKARLPHGSRSRGDGSRPVRRIPHRTDQPLARRPQRLCHDASAVGSLLPPVTSYGAAWPLPRPDFHWQAHHSFAGHTLDHHRRRFVLEFRRVLSAPLWHLSPFVLERNL